MNCDDCHHPPGDTRVRIICECPCHGVTGCGGKPGSTS